MYKTGIKAKYKSIFLSDPVMMSEVVVASLAFCLNSVPLTIIFFGLFISALFVMSDDVTPVILPFCLLSLSLTRQYGSKPEDYYVYIPVVVLLIISAILHFIIYPPVFRKGKLLIPSAAVAVALIAGGAFSINAKDYFAPSALYYTLTLGIGVTIAALVVYSYTRPDCSPARAVSSQMSYLTLGAVIMLFSQILPYLILSRFDWYFTWKNTLTTFLLLSSPFAFYTAAKEDFGLKAWANYALGIAGFGAAALSFSRGGILFGSISLVVCIVVTCIFCEKRNRIFFVLFTIISVAAAASFAAAGGLFQKLAEKMQVSSSEARIKLWKEAWNNFKNNPIFGAGVGYRGELDNFKPTSMYWYHSTPLQIIGTAGLVGVLAYGYNYAIKFRILFSSKRLYFVFFAIAFLGYEAYQLVDASDFVPIPFVMLITHLFIISEAYSCCPQDGREEPIKGGTLEQPQTD